MRTHTFPEIPDREATLELSASSGFTHFLKAERFFFLIKINLLLIPGHVIFSLFVCLKVRDFSILLAVSSLPLSALVQVTIAPGVRHQTGRVLRSRCDLSGSGRSELREYRPAVSGTPGTLQVAFKVRYCV